jgi:transposase
MNAVGIDISKGKSMVAVMRPFGEVVCAPFEISHTDKDLTDLAKMLKSLPGETRVVMEATGSYHLPVAWMLQSAGLYVSVVNALLVHDYGNNSLRRAKTDKKDAVKLANYALDRWLSLPEFAPEEENRQLLKACYRQYQHYSKIQTALSNNLISFLETVFPNVNRLFKSAVRADGRETWVDFVDSFWHKDCVSKLSAKSFTAKYQKWCKTHKYKFSEQKAVEIHTAAKSAVAAMPKNDVTKSIVQQAVSALRACSKALAELGKQMLLLASSLPEYPVVMKMFGVGPTLGPQLMAEIGDVRRFHSKKALVAYAGIDSPPNDSGQVVGKHKKMSKVGSSPLRRTLFLVMTSYLQRSPMDQPVFQFMNRKRAEGKPYKVYMMASANKFLRIYYSTVKAYLNNLNQT